ncbi:uroporphyrinogen decarboxylase family protein [Floccifex sp.]|uniref:uroporphyrinogen decarboxylase family protein n=1 Tax=Floccifex sp. TaxID=2815810 RepID=UPI003F099803
MDYSFKKWKQTQIINKNPMLILSFPGTKLISKTVKDVVTKKEDCISLIETVGKRANQQAAYIGLMDLSVEAEAFGMDIVFEENEVPNIKGKLFNNINDVQNFHVPSIEGTRCEMYVEAIETLAQKKLDKPLFAGAIGPFSLAGRLMDVSEIMMQCILNPDFVHEVLKKVSSFIESYLLAFKKAGANGVIVAEPLAGLLSPDFVETFSSIYLKDIVEHVQDDSFSIIYHNCGSSVPLALDSIMNIGCHGYHFGNAIQLKDVLPNAKKDVLIFGNIDPVSAFCEGSIEEMDQKVKEIYESCKDYPNWILSSGCDIPAKAKWENIDQCFESIKKWRKNDAKL